MIQERARVRLEYEDGVLHAAVYGEIDHHSARPLREELDQALYKYRPRRLIISLKCVSFMDSSGLGLILGRVNTAEDVGAVVEVTDPGTQIKKILTLAGASRLANLKIQG